MNIDEYVEHEFVDININGKIYSVDWKHPPAGSYVDRRTKIFDINQTDRHIVNIGEILNLYIDDNNIIATNNNQFKGKIDKESNIFEYALKALQSEIFFGLAKVELLPSTGNIFSSIRIIPKIKHIFRPKYHLNTELNEKGKSTDRISRSLTPGKNLILSSIEGKIFIGTYREGTFGEIISEDKLEILNLIEKGFEYTAKKLTPHTDNELFLQFKLL